MIGKVVSHYKILEQLGGGGMGIVYKAEDTRLKRIVALKFLSPELTRDIEAKERFIHEAQAASALQHNNICVVYDIDGTDDGQIFISMEYLQGETLKKKIERGPLKIEDAMAISAQIAQGLAKAHEHGIVHRDIKPANIMITTEGVAKIVDFGLAKLRGRSMLTKAGSTLGTVAYMSPEQAQGEPADDRTDIWSLGVVFYEMLTGRRPFESEYEQATIYAILSGEPKPIDELRPEVQVNIIEIAQRALEKDKDKRFQTAGELAEALLGDRKPERKRMLRRKKRVLWYGAASVFVIVAALGILMTMSRTDVIDSIAVLPPRNLLNVSGDEPLGEGILEGLITELGKIKSLSTIGRQSVMKFNRTDKTYAQIAAELGGVKTIVEPSFEHVGNKLQINARLIRASDGKVLWAGGFDKTMDDILVIQSEVVQTIAREIRVTLTPQEQTHLASARPVNAEVYQLYLQGRYHYARRTLAAFNKSIQLFQQVLEKDPDDALAYAGLAESYGILPFYGGALPKDAFPKAKAAALKALQLDNSLAEAHAALGFVLLYWDWDWQAAERELSEAIELKQSYVVAHHWYAEYLSAMGRHEQAVAEIKRAQELDPVSPLMLAIGGEVYNYAGRYDETIEQCLKAIEIDSNFALAHNNLSSAYSKKGMYKEAITEAEKSVRLFGGTSDALLWLASTYAAAGVRAKALEILDQVTQQSKRQAVEPSSIADVYACLGEKNRALDWLETAYDQRDPYMVFLNVEHQLDPLHSENRFQDLVRHMNLPATKR